MVNSGIQAKTTTFMRSERLPSFSAPAPFPHGVQWCSKAASLSDGPCMAAKMRTWSLQNACLILCTFKSRHLFLIIWFRPMHPKHRPRHLARGLRPSQEFRKQPGLCQPPRSLQQHEALHSQQGHFPSASPSRRVACQSSPRQRDPPSLRCQRKWHGWVHARRRPSKSSRSCCTPCPQLRGYWSQRLSRGIRRKCECQERSNSVKKHQMQRFHHILCSFMGRSSTMIRQKMNCVG